jgi:hypothetical protein
MIDVSDDGDVTQFHRASSFRLIWEATLKWAQRAGLLPESQAKVTVAPQQPSHVRILRAIWGDNRGRSGEL